MRYNRAYIKSILVTVFLLFLVSGVEAYTALEPWQVTCITGRINLELRMNPAYKMQNEASLIPGSIGDCSGKVYAIFAS